jgi:hypothetical protein
MNQNSKNFRDFLKKQKAKPIQKIEINKFNILYENPQEFIKNYKLLFPLSENIRDQSNITVTQHYFLAMENFLLSKDEENYKILFDNMEEFVDYILQNFQDAREESVSGDTILHYLAKKKKFEYLLKICEFFKNFINEINSGSQFNFGELCMKKNDTGMEFFKYIKYDLKNSSEVTNKIYEILLEIPKVSEIISTVIENNQLGFYFEEFEIFLKNKNFDEIIFSRIIDKLSQNQFTELFFYKNSGFNIFNYFIDRGEEKIISKLLIKISTFKNKEKIIFDNMLSNGNNILIHTVKKNKILIFENLLKFFNENLIVNVNELEENNFLDEKIFLDATLSRNNIFHLICTLDTPEQKLFFNEIISFLEKHKSSLISGLINKHNNYGELPLVSFLKYSFSKTDNFNSEVLQSLLNLTNSEIFNSKIENNKNPKQYRIIHPSEILLNKLNPTEDFENLLKFLNKNNLFSPFHKISSLEKSDGTVLSNINFYCKNLSDESKNLIFSKFIQFIEDDKVLYTHNFNLIFDQRVNLYDMLNFINKFKPEKFETFSEKICLKLNLFKLNEKENEKKKYCLIYPNTNDYFYLYRTSVLLKNKKAKIDFDFSQYFSENKRRNVNFDKFSLIHPLITYLNTIQEKENFNLIIKSIFDLTSKDTLFELLSYLCKNLSNNNINYLNEFVNSNLQVICDKFNGLTNSIIDQEEFVVKMYFFIFPFYVQDIKTWSRKYNLFNSLLNLISEENQNALKVILKDMVVYFKFTQRIKNDVIKKNIFKREADFNMIKFLIGVYCLDDKEKKLEYFNFYDKITSNEINLFFNKKEKNKEILQANFDIKEIISNFNNNIDKQDQGEEIKFKYDLMNLFYTNLGKVIKDKSYLFNLYFNPNLSNISKNISFEKNKGQLIIHEREKIKTHINNLIDNLLPICNKIINNSKYEVSEEDDLILIKNFIFSENYNHLKQLRNKNVDDNNESIIKSKNKIAEIKNILKTSHLKDFEQVLQNSFNNQISYLFKNFNYEKEKDYLLIRYINKSINKNTNYKQILLSSFPINFFIEKSTFNSSPVNSILTENSNFLTSYNLFTFLFNYDNISDEILKSQYIHLFKQIKEADKINNYLCEKDSKYVQADSKFLLKFVNSFPVEKFINNFDKFLKDMTNEEKINFNEFLNNKSYAESLACIIYHLLKKYFENKIKINSKNLKTFFESYIQFPQLFDYKNEYNSKLILITVKFFVFLENKSIILENSAKNNFIQNILKIETYPYFTSQDSFISSISYITQELLKSADFKYFDIFIRNLLQVNNDKKLLTIILRRSPTGVLKKIISAYFIFIDDLENLKFVENIVQSEIDLLERFDLKEEVIFNTIKKQRNKFTQFLHKFNNSTLFYLALLNKNNFICESKVLEYFNSKISFEKLINLHNNDEKYITDEKKLNFDLIKSILISKDLNLIKTFQEILIFADLKNYYNISTYYKESADLYFTHIQEFTKLFSDFNLFKLFSACINTKNMTLAIEIFKNQNSIVDKKNLIVSSYEIDENYKIAKNNFDENLHEDLISLLIINNEPEFLNSIIDLFKNEEEKFYLFKNKNFTLKNGNNNNPLKISIKINSFYCFILLFPFYPSDYINNILKGEKIFFTRMINKFKDDIQFKNLVKINNPELFIIFTIHEDLLSYLNESNRSDISLIYENLRRILFSGFKSIGKEII